MHFGVRLHRLRIILNSNLGTLNQIESNQVSCNSVYGFTGASKGMLPCVAIASSVTSIGQDMIKLTTKTVVHPQTLKCV